MSSKLTSLAAKNSKSEMADIHSFECGFKQAFKVLNEMLDNEMLELDKYPWMGERIMTLKIYRAKINNILKEMEQEYV